MSSNQNLQLWVVHFMSSYYDDGIVPVDERFFVVAENYDQAIEKCKSELKKLKKKYVKNEIKAIPLPMETLIVARDSSNDGRLGWHSNSKLKPVLLSLEKDNKEYRLVVCLIPKK
ncbi:MAG TPA: hypothetical protein VIK86_02755 [Candidatus Paceibacterota bacterium]